MKSYTNELPNKTSKVEWNYPVDIPPLSEDQIRQIEATLDPYYLERKNVEVCFKGRFIDPFRIALKKFGVIKKINKVIDAKFKEEEYPTDVVMLLLYEDSVKYCAITFSEIAKKLVVFIKDVEGKYLPYLRRDSLESIVEKLSEGNSKNAVEYKKRLSEYCEAWDRFFPNGVNKKGGPQIQDLSNLKVEVQSFVTNLTSYRDKVAAHFDDEVAAKGLLPSLLWAELESIVFYLQGFLQDFHFLLTHAKVQCDDLDGIGFTSEENTVKSFISGIFQAYGK